jgi:hypothetical protein
MNVPGQNFVISLDKSQSSPTLTATDTGTYPGGVPQELIGWFSITQPDQITVGGSATAPNVQWQSGRLTQGIFSLRLDNSNNFQQGAYTITYTIRVPGYTDTVLTQVLILSYAPPVLAMSNSLNLFTPDLQVTDTTNYNQVGMNVLSTTDNWSVVIQSVLGNNQTVTGTANPFDMNYMGGYYDSLYVITLTATPSFQPQSALWVTLIDKIILTQTLQAQIPPTLTQLQAGLTTLKLTLDATLPSDPNYPTILNNYNLASSIYDNLVRRGNNNDLSGLDTYIFQLLKIFNNNVNPTYVNTNGLIPPYVWTSGGSSSVAWINITGKPSTILVEGYVGTVMPAGSTYTDARLVGIPPAQLLVFRNTVPQPNSNLEGSYGSTYITKVTGNGFLTFTPAVANGEYIKILIAPL